MNALAGGHIDLAFDNMTLAWPQAQSGTVRAIAVTSKERSPTAPDVPAMTETLPGFEATSWHGLFVPAGTPRPIVERLAAEVKAIFDDPEQKKKLMEIGAVASPMTPGGVRPVHRRRAAQVAGRRQGGGRADPIARFRDPARGPRRVRPSRSPLLEPSGAPPFPRDPRQAEDREHGDPVHRALQAGPAQPVHPGRSPAQPAAGPMVGEAFTLRYIPAREDLNPLTVFQDRAHPQRKAVEECPPGAVFVIDSRKDARAASAGSILVSRLMRRGVAGVVTDGGFRDSPRSPGSAIPAYHNRPSAPTNLTDPPGPRHQRADRLRRRAGLAGRRGGGRRRGRGRDPGASRRRDRGRGGRDDGLRGFRRPRRCLKGRSILGLYPATDEQTKTDYAAWRQANSR